MTDPAEIRVGSLYLDCFFHPTLCTYVDAEDDEIGGVSLIDGTTPRACSPQHCGPEPIDLERAMAIKKSGEGWSACPTCGHANAWHHDEGCRYSGGCDCQLPAAESRSRQLPILGSAARGRDQRTASFGSLPDQTDDDLRWTYALWWISSEDEFRMITNKDSRHYYEDVDLDDEYEVTLPIRDIAQDALRATLQLLGDRGYSLWKSGHVIGLPGSSEWTSPTR
jgi:hypothetical protein